MKKSEEIRNGRDDKQKLLKDFNYIVSSDVNVEFIRLFLNRFVDSWINRKKDQYEYNLYWSKESIERKIIRERNNKKEKEEKKQVEQTLSGKEKEEALKRIEQSYKGLRKKLAFNNEHLVPKVFFEDIFIDVPNKGIGKSNPTDFEKRLEKNYVFFTELKKSVFRDVEWDDYLTLFFDEYFDIVTLTKEEHNSLMYQTEMPDEFFEEGNKWSRYKYTKTVPIQMYQVDFRNLNKEILDWDDVTFETLLEGGYIQKQIDLDQYLPFNQDCVTSSIPCS